MEARPSTPAPGRAFQDDAVQHQFEREGFVRVPLFDPVELQHLWAAHQDLVGAEGGITFDTVRPDRRALRATTEAADPLWERVLDEVLVDHRVVFTAFVVKHPGDMSGMQPHEDRSFVDDRLGRSVTAWVPLVDCDPDLDNGWIGVVPGSHRLAPGLGGTGIPDWFGPYRGTMADHLVAVPARAGEAVIWDSRLVHGSPPNRSDLPRPVLVAALAPRRLDLVQVRGTSRRGRRVHRVDREFHLAHSPIDVGRRMPDYPVIDERDEASPDVPPEAIARLCGLDTPPVPLVERPEDDWFGDGSASSPRRVDAGAHAALVASLEAAVTALGDDLPAMPSAEGRSAGGADLPSGATGRLEGRVEVVRVVQGGQATRAGRGVFPRSVELVAALGPGITAELVVLDGPSAYGRRCARTATDVLVPLTMPSGGAGVAWSEGALPLELGLAVVLPHAADHQVWSSSHDPVVLLSVRSTTGPGVAVVPPGAGRGRRLAARLIGRRGATRHPSRSVR